PVAGTQTGTDEPGSTSIGAAARVSSAASGPAGPGDIAAVGAAAAATGIAAGDSTVTRAAGVGPVAGRQAGADWSDVISAGATTTASAADDSGRAGSVATVTQARADGIAACVVAA